MCEKNKQTGFRWHWNWQAQGPHLSLWSQAVLPLGPPLPPQHRRCASITHPPPLGIGFLQGVAAAQRTQARQLLTPPNRGWGAPRQSSRQAAQQSAEQQDQAGCPTLLQGCLCTGTHLTRKLLALPNTLRGGRPLQPLQYHCSTSSRTWAAPEPHDAVVPLAVLQPHDVPQLVDGFHSTALLEGLHISLSMAIEPVVQPACIPGTWQ